MGCLLGCRDFGVLRASWLYAIVRGDGDDLRRKQHPTRGTFRSPADARCQCISTPSPTLRDRNSVIIRLCTSHASRFQVVQSCPLLEA